MASQAMNATLRITQRTYSRKISHVLSGNTRSLSSTSNPASRASATRTTAFVTAHSGTATRSSRVLAGIRTYSNQSESRSSSTQEHLRESFEDKPAEQNLGAPYGRKDRTPDRTVGPSRTLFVAGLPFFSTEEDIRALFTDLGTVTNVRIGSPKVGHNAAFALVTMSSVSEAVAIVESAQEEPFVMEGRTVNVNYSRRKPFPPSNALFFNNFNGGDLAALREFLGHNAKLVDNAWFTRDKAAGTFQPAGLIICRSVEDATAIIEDCNLKPGPDGLPVLLRYAKTDGPNRERTPRRNNPESEQSES